MFSLWPAFSQSRAANSETLRGGRIFGSRFGRQRGNLLIVSQVAMALSLLVVSALAVQSMLNLRRTSLGMDVNHVLTFKFDLPNDRYPNDDARREFVQRVSTELQAMPGVRGAALASHLPVFDPEVTRTFTGTLNDGTPEGGHPYASWFAVTPSFFETCGIPLVTGRWLNEGDRGGSASRGRSFAPCGLALLQRSPERGGPDDSVVHWRHRDDGRHDRWRGRRHEGLEHHGRHAADLCAVRAGAGCWR